MPMKDPPHPGELVRYECLEPLGLTVTEAARKLGISRQALNNIVNGRSRISADMAVRLSKAFGSTAEFWLRLQMNHDLAQIKKTAHRIKVKKIRLPLVEEREMPHR